MYSVSYIDRALISLLVDPIRKSLQIGDFGVSLVQGAAFGVFYGLFGLPMGWLVDHYSKRWVLFGGIGIWSLSAAACGLARSLPVLALARFGVGAGEATLVPVAYSTIASTFPRHQISRAIAIFTLGSSIGSALALYVGGIAIAITTRWGTVELPIIGLVEPWQMVFLITGLPGLLVALLAFTLPREPKKVRETAGKNAADIIRLIPYLRGNSYFWLNVLGLSLATILAYAVAAWAPTYLLRVRGVSVAEVGSIIGTTFGLGGAVGLLIAGTFSDRLLARGYLDAQQRIAFFAFLAAIPCAIAAFALELTPWMSATAMGAIIGSAISTNPLASHIQITTAPHLRGRVAAVQNLCMHLTGMIIGPSMVALITEYGFHDTKMVGYSILISVLIITPLILVCLGLTRRPSRVAMELSNARERENNRMGKTDAVTA
jgi:MFS family permease